MSDRKPTPEHQKEIQSHLDTLPAVLMCQRCLREFTVSPGVEAPKDCPFCGAKE